MKNGMNFAKNKSKVKSSYGQLASGCSPTSIYRKQEVSPL